MQVYIFDEDKSLERLGTEETSVLQLLGLVAKGTDTTDLVVAAYFRSTTNVWFGSAFSLQQTRDSFIVNKGKWAFARLFGIPDDLPAQYKLIRICFGCKRTRWPRWERGKHLRLRFSSFTSQLAHLFAHELHHYRRFHLGLHGRELEIGADRWALRRCEEIGLGITVTEHKSKRARQPSDTMNKDDFVPKENPQLLSRMRNMMTHLSIKDLDMLVSVALKRKRTLSDRIQHIEVKTNWEETLKRFAPGTRHKVIEAGKYPELVGRIAIVTHKPRRNSGRVRIEIDGKKWKWPRNWLEPQE